MPCLAGALQQKGFDALLDASEPFAEFVGPHQGAVDAAGAVIKNSFVLGRPDGELQFGDRPRPTEGPPTPRPSFTQAVVWAANMTAISAERVATRAATVSGAPRP